MDTLFGPEAHDGDYAIVVDFNYVGRDVKILPAIVHKGKACTGVMTSGINRRYINKMTAVVKIDESFLNHEQISTLKKYINFLRGDNNK